MSSLELEISSGRTSNNNNSYGYATNNNNSIMQKPVPAPSTPACAQLIHGKEGDPLEGSAANTSDPSSVALLVLESSEDSECDQRRRHLEVRANDERLHNIFKHILTRSYSIPIS